MVNFVSTPPKILTSFLDKFHDVFTRPAFFSFSVYVSSFPESSSGLKEQIFKLLLPEIFLQIMRIYSTLSLKQNGMKKNLTTVVSKSLSQTAQLKPVKKVFSLLMTPVAKNGASKPKVLKSSITAPKMSSQTAISSSLLPIVTTENVSQ